MIYIRTDANKRAATGHVMRCITVAGQLRSLGGQVLFLFRDEESVSLLPEGFKYIKLKLCVDIHDEIQEIETVMREQGRGKVLLDSYEFTATYMERLKAVAEKVITFDDLFKETYPVDLLINYNLYYKKFDYGARYSESGAQLLLGGDYVPLRQEFQVAGSGCRTRVETILLICGGGDPLGFLAAMLKQVCQADLQARYHFIVVAGKLTSRIDILRDYAKHYPQIELLENVKGMAGVLQRADLVVSAASTVLYECCCVGVPTIFFTVAENQKYDTDVFSEAGMMLYAGDFQREGKGVLEQIICLIEKASLDVDCRKKMAERMKDVVDGKGARRIAEAILAL